MDLGTGSFGKVGVIGRASRLALLLAICTASSARADTPAPAPASARGRAKRVLALFDFGKDSPANVIWDRAIRETLEAAGPGAVEYHAEFFDAARFTDERHVMVMHDYLGRKYAERPVDVIISMDLTSRFLLGPGRDLFQNVPIVHTAALGNHPAASSSDPRLTGIRGVFDARRTLELALGFHPATDEVVVVCGTARRDGFLETEARRQLAGFERRVKLTYLVDLSLEETLARVRALSPQTLVLFVVFYDPGDTDNPARSPTEVATEIARTSRVPVYGLYSSYLHDGVVGGYVYSLDEAGAHAARLALRILDGARPQDLPPEEAPIVPTFDWRQLRRWGIDESRLPPGSRVLFRQPSVWQAYKGYFVGAATLFVLELGLIGGLLLERRGRRLALRAVERSHAELEQRIAERERAEEELRANHQRLALVEDAGQALREADRRKDEFLATLGHELRNPLAPIWMAVEIMRQLPSEDERLVWAREMIARQVEQLSRLVDDLLDLSRITLGKIELRQEALDLGAIAQQALESSRPLLAERKHQLAVELPPEPVRVRGDAVRLTQVIANLLNNAGKYTDSGGRVSLRVERAGSAAVVTVADSGIGIPPDMLAHVFDLFAQVENARERAQGGLGIGLTLVKRIVEMHGGSVRAASAGPGRGSEFVVKLPALAEGVVVDSAGTPATTGSGRVSVRRVPTLRPPVSRRILVADDNVDAAESLRRALALRRHVVDVVHDGVEAVQAAERLSPDVVLLDIDLPRLDGLEVARRLRARWDRDCVRRPLLVATTGLGREVDRRRTSEAGFDHHLVKPIDLASLESLLETRRV
jgi:signal transduction histidine kinase/CheY-like chemotaxis protein